VTAEYQAMNGSVVRDVVESPERSVNHSPKASAEMPPCGARDGSVSRLAAVGRRINKAATMATEWLCESI